MLKRGISKLKGVNKKLSMGLMAMALMIMAALPASAAAPETLTDMTGVLVDGAGEMKTNALTIIGAVIAIMVIIFGISWLIVIFKKKMSKAS